MFDNIFKVIYFVEFVLITIVRTIQTTKYRKLGIAIDRKTISDIILLALAGICMIIPLIDVFSSLFDFAGYRFPHWIGWVGVILFAIAIWLLWRSHVDLGRNWTPTLGLRSNHQMVTDGVFKYIRHPMYAAHLLWGIAQALMLHNWIAGFSLLIVVIPQYLLRFRAEEQMILEKFGDQYHHYMRKTGRIIPKLGN